MSGFTPGPWVYKEFIGKYKNELGEIVTTKKKYSNILVGNDVIFIIGNYGVWSPKTSEDVSNMHLIAAAPDLYNALENVMHEIQFLGDEEHYFGTTERFDAARAALARARGETP